MGRNRDAHIREIQRVNESSNHLEEKWCELSKKLNSLSILHSFISHNYIAPSAVTHLFYLSISLLYNDERVYVSNEERSREVKNWEELKTEKRRFTHRAWHAVPECVLLSLLLLLQCTEEFHGTHTCVCRCKCMCERGLISFRFHSLHFTI